MINGIEYTNVVKTTGLSDYLRKIGQKVGIDFLISDRAVVSTGCTVAMPVTYRLKVANIIRNGYWGCTTNIPYFINFLILQEN